MNALKKISVFLSLDKKTQLLFIEAFIYLGWARFLVFMPFSKVAPTLGSYMNETSRSETPQNSPIIKNVAQVINIASRYTLWDSKCLVRAIAALKMLERRRIESTLYLGTAKERNGELIAHAWLRSGPIYITGAEGKSRFTIVGKFANYQEGA